jgi:Cytochrome P460
MALISPIRNINMTLHAATQALGAFGVCTALAVCTLYVAKSTAQSTKDDPQVGSEVAPIYGVRIPAGYRDWALVNVAHEAGNLNDFRVVLGNAVAMKAFRDGTLPFPDGTIIARLAWKYVPSPENNAVFGRAQSFVTGAPTNLEFMVKDSKKYATTAGWGFGQFTNGKPDDEAVHKACFPCHGPAKGNDFLFTRYAP